MAVETRYVVMRNGAEVKTFMDKKQADEYDKMLDMAECLSALLSQSPMGLEDAQLDELSVFLAEHREELLIALQAKKVKPVKVNKPKDDEQSLTGNTQATLKEVS